VDVLEFFELLDKLYDLDNQVPVDQRLEAAAKLIQDNAHAVEQNQQTLTTLTKSVKDLRLARADDLNRGVEKIAFTAVSIVAIFVFLILLFRHIDRLEKRLIRLEAKLEAAASRPQIETPVS